jgi:hypothetical protein
MSDVYNTMIALVIWKIDFSVLHVSGLVCGGNRRKAVHKSQFPRNEENALLRK